ncbi:hypothetical protein [Mesorhizobium sp.]|uniref:hypothetical protein n=1 Tax=Mesorhizobium sp. TaxID=1871066 RepID=UPI000FE6C83B|nr:hypothetical protein [Mesorhizobium sp.]RWC67094.1 MAG: hypothetical protein EOS29_01405 [Mesorhizobium sp.]
MGLFSVSKSNQGASNSTISSANTTKFIGSILNFLCFVLISAVLSACSSSEDHSQLRTAASAAETASMALDAWLAGAAPQNYTSRTLQSIGRKLSDAETQIQSADSPEVPDRAGLITVISRLAAAIANAEAGLQENNPARVERAQRDVRNAIAALAATHTKSFSPHP